MTCYRGEMCPQDNEVGLFSTPQECCTLDEAVSWESGGEPCTQCLGK